MRHRRGRKHSSDSSSWAAYFQANNKDFDFWSAEWAAARAQLLRLAVLDGLDPTRTAGNASAARAPAKVAAINASAKVSMLQGLRESSAARVEGLKAQENKSKTLFDEQDAKHKDRLAKIEARFAQKQLDSEFHAKETKEESRQWGYWLRSRERQTSQLQVALRIQQGLTDSTKRLLEAYKQPLSAKLEDAQRSVKSFCHGAWADVEKEREALEKALPESL